MIKHLRKAFIRELVKAGAKDQSRCLTSITLSPSFTHAFIRFCTHSLLHSLTLPLFLSHTHLLSHSFTFALIHSCTHLLLHSSPLKLIQNALIHHHTCSL